MNDTSGLTGERVYDGNGGRSETYELFVAVEIDERFAMVNDSMVGSYRGAHRTGEGRDGLCGEKVVTAMPFKGLSRVERIASRQVTR